MIKGFLIPYLRNTLETPGKLKQTSLQKIQQQKNTEVFVLKKI